MSIERIAVGRYIYLFKSNTNLVDCVISAHGGYVFENRSFEVPAGVTLSFFAEHGNTLTDPGMAKLMAQLADAQPAETLTGGQLCKNYLLSKYQGRHGSKDETYDSIKADIEKADKQRLDFQAGIGIAALKGNKPGVQMLLRGLAHSSGASVVTIRNRWNVLFGIPLADVIKEVRKVAPGLSDFYCSFCRSNMFVAEQPTNKVVFV
jgi:hypothetical protein